MIDQEELPKNTSDGVTKIFDPLSKILTVLLLVAYGSGYLTVSLYYSSLGMGLTSPLKPEILLAGFVFLLMTASPIWASYQIFKVDELKATVQSWDYVTTIIRGASQLYTFSVLLAVPASTIFVFSSYNPSKWNTAAYVLIYALDAAVWATMSNSRRVKELIRRAPWILWLVISAILLSWLFISINPGLGFTRRRLSLWFFASGFIPMIALTPNLKEPYRVSWPHQGLLILFFLAFFPTLVYPHIANKWGGGEPVRVVLTLSKDSAVLPQKSLHVRLVAQDDAGIYVLTTGGRKATFIPRSSIGAILYSDDQSDKIHE